MRNQSTAIHYNFPEGTFSYANWREKVGLSLMQTCAKATAFMDYKGLSLAVKTLRTCLPSERYLETETYPDVHFSFPYGDAYWSVLLNENKHYTPDVEDFLLSVQNEDYAFIDCGANYGYMSALVTSKTFGSKPAIAIEPHPDTFKILKKNAEINENRFDLINKAVFSKSGEWVQMDDAKHEARSILHGEESETRSGNVETLALDDLLGWVSEQNCENTILKLDVEGVEIQAMMGAKILSENRLLVLFEDHGSDKTNEVSTYFIKELGMQVFAWIDGGLKEMTTPEEFTAHKRFSHTGYDFIATKSPEWLKALNLQ